MSALTCFVWRCLPLKKILIIVLVIIVIQGCLNSISQSVYSDLVDTKSSYPKAERCGECHVDIYNEWKSSKHSSAYTSEMFRQQTNNYQFSECLACHAPNTIFTENLRLRSMIREEGVTCAVCHLQDGKFAGPVEHSALILPHPIEIRTNVYRSSRLCGQCHEEAYREWQGVKNPKKNCQECHMSTVERRITQGTDFISKQLVKFEHEGKLRRHLFHLSEIVQLKDAISVKVSVLPGEESTKKVLFSLTNNLPHGIPTGGFGFRKAVLTLKVVDEKNRTLTAVEHLFFKELKTALPAKKTWQKTLTVSKTAKWMHITLERKDREQSIEIYRDKVVLP